MKSWTPILLLGLASTALIYSLPSGIKDGSFASVPGPQNKSDLHFLMGGVFNIEPYTAMAQQYGDVVHYTMTRGEYVLVSGAPELDQVFTSGNFDNRRNPDFFGYTYGRAGGHRDGTFTSAITNTLYPTEWEKHKSVMHEKIIPAYSTYIPKINEIARNFMKRLSSHVGEEYYEPYNDAREYAWNLTCHFNFGIDALYADPQHAKKLFAASLSWLDVFPYFAPFKYPWSWMLTPWVKRVDDALDTWSDWMDARLAEKRRTGNFGTDWLGVHASTPVNGSLLDDHAIKAISFELMEANVGPFPSLVTYGLYLLGANPDVQQKLYEELKNAIGDRDVTVSDIHKLPILTHIAKEVVRKYPAGGGINIRTTYRDADIGGYLIPKNVNIVTAVVTSQNDPRYWENPTEFNPHRWDNSTLPLPGSFTVWGGGDRGCPGKQFAILGGAVTFAHVIRNFEIRYTAPEPPKMAFTCIATFKTPVQIEVIPRQPIAK